MQAALLALVITLVVLKLRLHHAPLSFRYGGF